MTKKQKLIKSILYCINTIYIVVLPVLGLYVILINKDPKGIIDICFALLLSASDRRYKKKFPRLQKRLGKKIDTLLESVRLFIVLSILSGKTILCTLNGIKGNSK